MGNRDTDMQAIFNELSEKNKDIMILIDKSVKVAQETEPEKNRKSVDGRRLFGLT